METELLETMKKGLRTFKPEMFSKTRTIRFAEDVYTPTGIVDVIRFEDFVSRDSSFCMLIDHLKLPENKRRQLKLFVNNLGECKIKHLNYPNDKCYSCVWNNNAREIDILVTCYECKVSIDDFKFSNKHNFHGNKNYYVVPKSLVKQIEELVPDDIGIISYNEKTDKYRVYKECEIKNIDNELKSRLLYEALKKWVNKFETKY